MKNDFPTVQAVIVTWNKKKDLLYLLCQMHDLRYPSDRLSILVVDNASIDGTVEAVKADFPGVQVIRHSENRGGAGGFNAGMRWALDNRPQARYLWLLDNDVQVHPDALKALVEVLENHSNAAICGSRIMDVVNRGHLIEVGAFIDYNHGDIRRHEPNGCTSETLNGVYKVDYVAACSLLARTSMVKKVGLWQERFFIYWDDMEWGARINAAGYDVLAADASIIHHPRWENRNADHSSVWRTYYRTRNSFWFFNNYGRGFARRRLLFRMVMRYSGFAIKEAFNANESLSRAFIDGINDFFGNDLGKKRFNSWPATLFERIETDKIGQLVLFVMDGQTSIEAWNLVESLSIRFPDLKIRCILPICVKRVWRNNANVDECLFYHRRTRGGMSLIDKCRILLFLGSRPWQILVASRQAPKLGTVWGRLVARFDFGARKTISIDRMNWKSVCRLFLSLPVLMVKALVLLPEPERTAERN